MRNIIILIFISVSLFHSCLEKKSIESINETNPLIGKKVKLMPHAVSLFITDSIHTQVDFNAPLKLVTYGDLYCEPCWKKIPLWKEIISDFRKYPYLSFLCYVQAREEDFYEMNKKVKLNFPVLLDTRGRFKAVNQIGNQPQNTTFLLNDKNEIIMAGDPNLFEIRKKYLKVIEKHKRDYH